jgi:hypothetical protein
VDSIHRIGGWTCAFATGTRTIARHPEADDTHRWQGTIDNPSYPGRIWRGRDIESVIEPMERDLGPIDEPGQPTKYVITE